MQACAMHVRPKHVCSSIQQRVVPWEARCHTWCSTIGSGVRKESLLLLIMTQQATALVNCHSRRCYWGCCCCHSNTRASTNQPFILLLCVHQTHSCKSGHQLGTKVSPEVLTSSVCEDMHPATMCKMHLVPVVSCKPGWSDAPDKEEPLLWQQE